MAARKASRVEGNMKGPKRPRSRAVPVPMRSGRGLLPKPIGRGGWVRKEALTRWRSEEKNETRRDRARFFAIGLSEL